MQALYANTTGEQNVAVGALALDAQTTASYNTAIGYDTLSANTTWNCSDSFRLGCLKTNTTGSENTACGANTLYYKHNRKLQHFFRLGNLWYQQYNCKLGNTGLGYRALGCIIQLEKSNLAVGAMQLDSITTVQQHGCWIMLVRYKGYENTQ